MHNKLLLTVLLVALSGCNAHAPKPIQIPADQWVDARIGQNALSVSQAQTRLHQTSAVRPFTPVSAPVLPPAVITPVRPVPTPGG
jgi:hypothetical protein